MTAPLTIVESAAAIRAGQLSAVELVRECLRRIDADEPRVRALLARLDEPALAAAEQCDAERADGRLRGPLHGIPIVIKDHIDVAGAPTTAGTAILAANVARDDAVVITRLRAAGAVVLGKANTHELAFGATTPPTRNPRDLARIPGGSSGGSAAAVAAGMVPGAVGTDSGASIREPAALCGIVGHKPTAGWVSCRGVVPFAWSLDTVGPMASTVEDCAVLLRAMAPTSAAGETPALSSLRFGVVRELQAPLQPDVAERFSALLDVLAGSGARVEHVGIGNVDDMLAAVLVIVGSEAFTYQRPWLARHRALYSPDVLEQVEMGREYSATDYLDACRVRTSICDRVSSLLEEVDALVTPASFAVAPRVGETRLSFPDGDRPLVPTLIRPLAPFALSGHPAVSVPIGRGRASGLPVGAQLVGSRDGDLRLLAIASAIEKALSNAGPATAEADSSTRDRPTETTPESATP